MELYFLHGHQHHSGQLIAYLPKERILMYGDGYNPPAGDEIRTPERGPDFAAQLVQKVNELKLNPERIAPVHGRVVPYKNLLIAFNLEGSAREGSTLGGGRCVVACSRVVAGSVAAFLVSTSALAHHGAASIYDMSKETTMKATVTEYVWTNPHVEVGIARRTAARRPSCCSSSALRRTSGIEGGRAAR